MRSIRFVSLVLAPIWAFASAVLSSDPHIVTADFELGGSSTELQLAADEAAGGALTLRPGETYVLTRPLRLRSGTRVVGNGATLRFAGYSTVPGMNSGLLDIDEVHDIAISDVTLDGNAMDQRHWSEWRHLVRVRHSRNIFIYNSLFVNPIGDAVYISHRDHQGPELGCSHDIRIVNNRFLGNHRNRNGVSVVCGTHILVQGNSFVGMARPDMPGSIDVEPTLRSDVVEDVRIIGNTVVTGDVRRGVIRAGVSIVNSVAAPVSAVHVAENVISGVFRYGVIFEGNYANRGDVNLAVVDNRIELSTGAAGTAVSVSGVPVHVAGNIDENAADAPAASHLVQHLRGWFSLVSACVIVNMAVLHKRRIRRRQGR